MSALKSQVQVLTSTLQQMNAAASYKRYQISFKKAALPKDDAVRQNIYLQTLKRIAGTNKNTNLKHVACCNKFTDQTFVELSVMLGLRRKAKLSSRRMTLEEVFGLHNLPRVDVDAAELEREGRALLQSPGDLPDWSIILPGVKNQGQCGSCWAFASVAMTEAGHYVNTQEVTSLSEKQLVDCNRANGGCNGGWYDAAFNYIKDTGLATSGAYPYLARQDTCPSSLPPIASRLASYTALPSNNEAAMLAALRDGPIAVAVTADNNWFDYSGGVFTSDTCGGTINHAVVIVGAGVDEDTQTPFWLIRNSWGSDWGEGGYMRILRGNSGAGMCNIAQYPYQVTSADDRKNPGPPPDNGCTAKTITVKASDSLMDLAKQYKSSMSQIMIDNGLAVNTPLYDGQQLTISCPGGTWSEPYGVWNDGHDNNGMVAVPSVGVCPPGQYAVSFYIKPSQWYTGGAWTGSTYVGQVTMTCSDGSTYTADAQPGFNPGWADGTSTQSNGFTTIPLRAGWAVDSMFGVGAQTGGELSFSCPQDTLVTGFSAGASPGQYPTGWIANLQFLCQNPFADVTKLRSFRLASFPKVATGLSCPVYPATGTDTWYSVAAAKKVDVLELMRANPAISRALKADDKVFIPPCNKGVLQGTKV